MQNRFLTIATIALALAGVCTLSLTGAEATDTEKFHITVREDQTRFLSRKMIDTWLEEDQDGVQTIIYQSRVTYAVESVELRHTRYDEY